MPESKTINSLPSLAAFHKYVEEQYKENKYITFDAPRVGPDRSLSQNALFHVWASEYVAYRQNKTRKDVTKGELKGMKLIIKKRFYETHPDSKPWILHIVVHPFNSKKSKLDYTSSADWKRGEMYIVLCWFQMVAANDGLVLESRGEFSKNQRIHEGQATEDIAEDEHENS